MKPLRIGLTGGIGSGKTTVSQLFAELGVPIIDADLIARELVEPCRPALTEIVAQFGEELLDSQGNLDRGKLRQRVFSDEAQRKTLEAILHPRIRAELNQRAEKTHAPYCILSIPLLLESGLESLVDRILVVDVSESTQVSRASDRDHVTASQIEDIMQKQVSRASRLAAADDILDNEKQDISGLRTQVIRLHQKYLALASPDSPHPGL